MPYRSLHTLKQSPQEQFLWYHMEWTMEVVRGEQERWGTTTGPKVEQGPHLGTQWGRKGKPSLEGDEVATDDLRGAPHTKMCFLCKKTMSWERLMPEPLGLLPIGKEWGLGINPQQTPPPPPTCHLCMQTHFLAMHGAGAASEKLWAALSEILGDASCLLHERSGKREKKHCYESAVPQDTEVGTVQHSMRLDHLCFLTGKPHSCCP